LKILQDVGDDDAIIGSVFDVGQVLEIANERRLLVRRIDIESIDVLHFATTEASCVAVVTNFQAATSDQCTVVQEKSLYVLAVDAPAAPLCVTVATGLDRHHEKPQSSWLAKPPLDSSRTIRFWIVSKDQAHKTGARAHRSAA
jgi:hypothetical protein